MTQGTWLITGVSSGFGRHLCQQLLDRGDRVIGTVRRPDSVADLAAKHPDNLRAGHLDVGTLRRSAPSSTGLSPTSAASTSWCASFVPFETPRRLDLLPVVLGIRGTIHLA